jgi:hypothetical protein
VSHSKFFAAKAASAANSNQVANSSAKKQTAEFAAESKKAGKIRVKN